MTPTQQDIKIARSLQGDIPLTKNPYQDIGKTVALDEALVIKTITALKQQGIIRKFGAVVRHQKAGYTHNALLIWAVPPSRCDAVGTLLASYPEITHCYERMPPFEGKYTIFSMVHFGQDGGKALIKRLTDAVSIQDYKILTSEEEFKKSSMEYF